MDRDRRLPVEHVNVVCMVGIVTDRYGRARTDHHQQPPETGVSISKAPFLPLKVTAECFPVVVASCAGGGDWGGGTDTLSAPAPGVGGGRHPFCPCPLV